MVQMSGDRLEKYQSGFEYSAVAIALIEHLEAVRRSYQADHDKLEIELSRIAHDTVSAVSTEHRELMGESDYEERLRPVIDSVLLPRYIDLATVQNELERRGFNAWRQGDPLARVMALGLGLVCAFGLIRIVHNPLAMLAIPFAVIPFFAPDIRRWMYRRRYLQLIQEVVDDMESIDVQHGRYATLENLPQKDE